MKVAVATFGTEGDTRPFVALARGLAAAGHTMTLVTDPGALPPEAADTPGLEVVPLSGQIRIMLGDTPMGAHVRSGSGGAVGLGSGLAVVRQLLDEHLTSWTQTFLEAAGDADVLVSSGLALSVGYIAADALDKPVTLAFPQPFEPTQDWAQPALGLDLPGPLRLPTNRLAEWGSWRALRGQVNRARAAVGLGPMRHTWRDPHQLIAISPSLVPRPTDWPERVVVTGDWPLSEAVDEVPAALADFVAAGEPPVYVGFGSMPVTRDQLGTVLAGLAGHRVVLATGWGESLAEALPNSVFAVGHVPHDWLLPRVALAVHHGGAGTTHAVCRAGVPSVPVPFVADQYFWARRLQQAGVAARGIPARRLTAPRITAAVEQAQATTATAQTLAAAMAQENGVANAVAELERLGAKSGRPTPSR